MTIDGFDLRHATLAIIEEGVLDPGLIAEKLISEIPDDALRDAMLRTLRDYVRHILASIRTGQFKPPADTRPARSGKWKMHSPRFLRSAYPVVPDEPWKPFLDCTVDDLVVLEASYRRRVAENLLYAERFAATVAAMQSRKVTVVGKLPPSVLSDIWGVSEENDE